METENIMNTATDKVVRYIASDLSIEDTIPEANDASYTSTPGNFDSFRSWVAGAGSAKAPPTIEPPGVNPEIHYDVTYLNGGTWIIGKVLGTCDISSNIA